MAKATPTETVDLLLARLAPDEHYEALADRAGISARSLWAMRTGRHGRTNRSTAAALAAALKVDVARVMAAVEASRAAAEKK